MLKNMKKYIALGVIILVILGTYRCAVSLMKFGSSSEEILMEKSENSTERVYKSSVNTGMGLPYCTMKVADVLYDSSQEDDKYVYSKDIFSNISDAEPDDKSLSLVNRVDLSSDIKIQYLLKPLEVVGFCNDYTIVYKYGVDDIEYIVVDYKNVPLDSSVTDLINPGYKERVLVNLNDYVLEDNILYVKGYKYGFDDIEECLVSLYCDEEDTEVRSARFIELYLSLPYSPFRNVSIYLVEEDELYYDFAVLYNDTEKMMVKTIKGGNPILFYSDSFPYSVERYLEYTGMFSRYEEGGDILWEREY